MNTLFVKDWDSIPLPTLPREGKLNEFDRWAPFLTSYVGPHYTINNARLESGQDSSVFFGGMQQNPSVGMSQNVISHPAQSQPGVPLTVA